jgi:hypothetical protein
MFPFNIEFNKFTVLGVVIGVTIVALARVAFGF